MVAVLPALVVIAKSARRADDWGGVVQVIKVLPVKLQLVAGMPSNVTELKPVKLVPEMDTVVLPTTGP